MQHIGRAEGAWKFRWNVLMVEWLAGSDEWMVDGG
jgi:hypothetical protein